jgi:hypothetical protein
LFLLPPPDETHSSLMTKTDCSLCYEKKYDQALLISHLQVF